MEKEEKPREENCSDIQYPTGETMWKEPMAVKMQWSVSFFSKDVVNSFFVLGPMLYAGCRKTDQVRQHMEILNN